MSATPESPHEVTYERTLNRSMLDRCHPCEWWYDVDDSEFPSKFVFELLYQVESGEVVLRGIVPKSVITADLQGNPLFQHDFAERERAGVWQWFHARLNRQSERLMSMMAEEIERDRQARSATTESTFLALQSELAVAG